FGGDCSSGGGSGSGVRTASRAARRESALTGGAYASNQNSASMTKAHRDSIIARLLRPSSPARRLHPAPNREKVNQGRCCGASTESPLLAFKQVRQAAEDRAFAARAASHRWCVGNDAVRQARERQAL